MIFKYFEFILNTNKDEIKSDFGVDVKDLGVYWLQKGATTHVSSGSIYGWSRVATKNILE